MKSRSAEAARLETDYLARVKAAIAGREASEVDEVIQSLREHIEEELLEKSDKQISLVQMANVLEQLGPPENYAQEEGISATTTIASEVKADEEKRRLSRLAVASVLCILGDLLVLVILSSVTLRPDDSGLRFGYFSIFAVSFTIPLVGMGLGIAALMAIHNAPKKLYGRVWAWIAVLVALMSIASGVSHLYWIDSSRHLNTLHLYQDMLMQDQNTDLLPKSK